MANIWAINVKGELERFVSIDGVTAYYKIHLIDNPNYVAS